MNTNGMMALNTILNKSFESKIKDKNITKDLPPSYKELFEENHCKNPNDETLKSLRVTRIIKKPLEVDIGAILGKYQLGLKHF